MSDERSDFYRAFQEKCADRIVRAGFAKGYVINDTTGIGEFDWTKDGEKLESFLKRLFNVPKVPASSVDGNELREL